MYIVYMEASVRQPVQSGGLGKDMYIDSDVLVQ